MTKISNSDIVRVAGDTYPNKVIIKINGVPMDLTGWRVDLRYKKNGEEYVINCVMADEKNGLVFIYPHARKRNSIPTDSEGFPEYLSPDDYRNSESTDEDGNPNGNQVWDEDEAGKIYPYYIVRYKKYGKYIEEMTHTVGKIILLNRYEQ